MIKQNNLMWTSLNARYVFIPLETGNWVFGFRASAGSCPIFQMVSPRYKYWEIFSMSCSFFFITCTYPYLVNACLLLFSFLLLLIVFHSTSWPFYCSVIFEPSCRHLARWLTECVWNQFHKPWLYHRSVLCRVLIDIKTSSGLISAGLLLSFSQQIGM